MYFFRKLVLLLSLVSIPVLVLAEESKSDDLYELLGIPRDADLKDIRQAFKKLAVKYHPDKNKDDKDADTKFIKLASAYEILKDPETRREYDLYGDIADRKQKKEYQSYTYYRDQFGIYDDDPLIVTLTKADFELNVIDGKQVWFVNFYSAQCHHCHELAPIWRKLAAQLEGVIRIGAVNCEEDWMLCRQLGVRSYPSLLYYENEATLYEGEKYQGDRSLDTLYNYVLSRIEVNVEAISATSWKDGLNKLNWLLFLCAEDNYLCPELETRRKLAAILDGLMPVGIITDPSLCDEIFKNHVVHPIVFWQTHQTETNFATEVHSIVAADDKEIVEKVLSVLPDPQIISEEGFRDIRTQLRLGATKPWLICFYMGHITELNLQLKRLPTWLPDVNIGLLHCGQSASLCSSLHISHYPTWGVLKEGGAFESHHGRDVSYEIVNFAKESTRSTNLHSLSPAEFQLFIKQGSPWFVDWYSPWCPPCRKMIPEIRRASQHFKPENVRFGTIDCTLHSTFCAREGIRAYPTTRLYNGSQIHHFHGVPNEDGIVEFVENMLHPLVVSLDDSSFDQLVKKPKEELWIVDFFAPWCAPCHRLTPQWHTLAKEVQHLDFVHVAQVDCVEHSDLCSGQNIRSYPTIRLYPLGSRGLNTVALYNGHFDSRSLKQWLMSFLPSAVEQLNQDKFKKEVLASKEYKYKPWLIDFYAPWCGHCVNFEPEFITVAEKLKDKVRSGKVNCDVEKGFCRSVDVTSYPTVFLYTSPFNRHEINTQVASEIIMEVERITRRHVGDEL